MFSKAVVLGMVFFEHNNNSCTTKKVTFFPFVWYIDCQIHITESSYSRFKLHVSIYVDFSYVVTLQGRHIQFEPGITLLSVIWFSQSIYQTKGQNVTFLVMHELLLCLQNIMPKASAFENMYFYMFSSLSCPNNQ